MTRQRTRRALASLLCAALLSSGLVVLHAVPASAASPAPPSGLPAAVEDPQPYVGQAVCDPVAKPGVVAFRDLLLRTYRGTGSLGIVRDCGAGGQSEHKEGRAFDWEVRYSSTTQRAQVAALFAWLLRDSGGQHDVMLRRLGIMYMIWHRQIYKAYDDRGWQYYDGADPHTGHVHFSFGWNGARKHTSYWTGHVAPLDFGPRPPLHVTPVRRVSNLSVLRAYGATTLTLPSTGAAVQVAQQALRVPADGDFGSGTTAAVARFELDQHLPAVQHVGPREWRALFPPPVVPFGSVDPPGAGVGSVLTGWALDADTPGPLTVRTVVDGVTAATSGAALLRADVVRSFPEYGGAHGYSVPLLLAPGTHQVCVTALNAPGSPGSDASLGCRGVTVGSATVGAVETARQVLGTTRVTGFAADPLQRLPVPVSLTVDGVPSAVVPSAVDRPELGGALGWAADLDLTAGSHQVCVLSAVVLLGCRSVAASHAAVAGSLVLTAVRGGVRATGFGLDPDTADPVLVIFAVDDLTSLPVLAATDRGDLTTRWPALGRRHGFLQDFGLPAGAHRVCVTALNVAGTPGAASPASCRSLTTR